MQLPTHFWCFAAMWAIGVVFTYCILRIKNKNVKTPNRELLGVLVLMWPFFWLVAGIIFTIIKFVKHVPPFCRYIWSYKRPA
jgi:hypothetical protein